MPAWTGTARSSRDCSALLSPAYWPRRAGARERVLPPLSPWGLQPTREAHQQGPANGEHSWECQAQAQCGGQGHQRALCPGRSGPFLGQL